MENAKDARAEANSRPAPRGDGEVGVLRDALERIVALPYFHGRIREAQEIAIAALEKTQGEGTKANNKKGTT